MQCASQAGASEVVLKASVEIDDELGSRIQRLANICHQPTDGFIRDAIEQHAIRMEARQSFVAEADASWDAYKQDALHLTGDEVCAWLKTVGSDDEAPLPDCHK